MYSITFWFVTSRNYYHDKLSDHPSSLIDIKLKKFLKSLPVMRTPKIWSFNNIQFTLHS